MLQSTSSDDIVRKTITLCIIVYLKWYIFAFSLQHGLTPLHVATHYDKEKVAIFLLDNEANPHIQAKV